MGTLFILPGLEPRVTKLQEQERKAYFSTVLYCSFLTQNKLDPDVLHSGSWTISLHIGRQLENGSRKIPLSYDHWTQEG